MDYLQHKNHMADGTHPWPGCYFCELFIIQPAMHAYRGDYGELNGRPFVELEGIDLEELAAEEAAA